MAKIKLPAALLAVLAAGGSAYQLMDVAVPIVEGNPLHAYLDIGGVPTICGGVTKGVKLGDVETVEGCTRRNREAIDIGLRDVARCVTTHDLMPESMKAGWGLFAYNVGGPKFCGSTAATLLRQGQYVQACDQLKRWRYVAGKDCTLKSSKCDGIIHRRSLEETLCAWDL